MNEYVICTYCAYVCSYFMSEARNNYERPRGTSRQTSFPYYLIIVPDVRKGCAIYCLLLCVVFVVEGSQSGKSMAYSIVQSYYRILSLFPSLS